MRVSRSMTAVGGVVLAAGVIAFATPKVVRAVPQVTTALVQVVNTATNPVVTRDATLAPGQLVELLCRGDNSSCFQVLPGGGMFPGGSSAAYVVPAGQSLVITDVDVLSSFGGGGTSNFALAFMPATCASCGSYTPPLTFDVYDLAGSPATHHFSLGRGIVWPSGVSVQTPGANGTQGILYGYLTAN